MGSPNIIAYVVLFSWPLVCLAVFGARRGRAPLANTVTWMLVLPLMFLPSNMAWDPPLLPPLNKLRVGLFSVWLALSVFHRAELKRRASGSWTPRLIFVLFSLAMAGTVMNNHDALFYPPVVLPGLTWYDYLSVFIQELLDLYLPFALAQRVFRDEKGLIEFFKVMSTAGLVYAPFMLFEVRMSPQLHNWIYGFYPSDFVQSMRQGGYRPIVFMKHGLSVAGWTLVCLISALALRRARLNLRRVGSGARVAIHWVMLILTKSMGPLIYGVLASVFRFWSVKATARLAVFVVVLVSAYPVLRAQGIFPAAGIVQTAAAVSADRAQSLEFRFDNEDVLLRHAMQRPWFGWGTFGRHHVYGWGGKQESVTDGQWIITLGTFGYVGHSLYFLFLFMPLLRFLRHYKRMPSRARGLCGMLALLLSIFELDLLPNAFSDYLVMVYAGMLWTLSEALARKRAKTPTPIEEEPIIELGTPREDIVPSLKFG
jgi:hypothetical protein